MRPAATRFLTVVLIPGLCAAAGLPLEVQSAVDLAASAPAEVAASALLRVAALERLDRQRRVELLEQAFALAPGAAQPYKRRTALLRTMEASAFLNRTYEQDLDTLSLQLQAVDGLLVLAPQKARQHFTEIAFLRLPPIGCDDFLVYDVDRFYGVLGRVASQTFSAKEIRDGEPAKFLAGYIGSISSGVQVAPAARLLATMSSSDSEFELLLATFAGALGRTSSDDRSFTYGARQAGPALQALAALCRRRGISAQVVLDAYRQFLINHLSGARCADDTRSAWNEAGATPAAYFNDHLFTPPLQPIDEGAIVPSKTEGEAKGLEWCESPECRAIRERYLGLVIGASGAAQQRDRENTDWQAKVRDFLAALTEWTQSTGAPPTAQFREKLWFFNELLVVVPDGPTRVFVLRSMLQFLAQTRLPPESRLEWILPVSQLAARLSLDPLGFGLMGDDLRRVNDPVIALYMALETVAPRSSNEVIPLL